MPVDVALKSVDIDGTAFTIIAVRDDTHRRRLVLSEMAAQEQTRFRHGYWLRWVRRSSPPISTNTSSTWNAAAEGLYGWPTDEVLGLPILGITTREESAEQSLQIRAALSRGNSWSGECRVRRRDGSTFPALVTDTPIYDDAGEAIGVIGVSTTCLTCIWRRRC